ncbi:6861_t:CDS:2 [Entrophospora sp. SA101]|nr:6861_t:CDS:2 [Entrophospora sp. SA101]
MIIFSTRPKNYLLHGKYNNQVPIGLSRRASKAYGINLVVSGRLRREIGLKVDYAITSVGKVEF